MNEDKKKWGGRREGAGRPVGSLTSTIPPENRRERLGIRLPRWMIEKLKSQEGSAGKIIELALEEHFKQIA